MLNSGVRCPATTSAGRWFDAAAGLLGLKEVMRFEGQAAMLLEGLASAHGPVEPAPDDYSLDGMTLNLLPLIGRMADAPDAGFGAALFHYSLARALAGWAEEAARRTGIAEVVLSGGCFMNRVLSDEVGRLLGQAGIRFYEACELPPNDGGIAAGQAWVALMGRTG